jgi:hypothetical protein
MYVGDTLWLQIVAAVFFGIFQELGLRLASAGHDSIQGFASPQQIDSVSLRLRRSDYDYRPTASSR